MSSPTNQQPSAFNNIPSAMFCRGTSLESRPEVRPDARLDKPTQGPFARVGACGPATSANSGATTAGSSGGGGAKPRTPSGAFQAKRVASGALDGPSVKPILVTVCCGSQTGVYDVRKGSITIRFGLQGKVRPCQPVLWSDCSVPTLQQQ